MEIKSGTNYCYNRHPPQDQVPPQTRHPPRPGTPPSTSGQYASYLNAILYFPNFALADLRGSGQRVSCSFWENLAKSYVGTPPFGELAPPPRENPGSADPPRENPGSATVQCEKVACGHPPLNERSVFPRREGEGVLKYYFMTRMHSSRMRTARSLTVSRSICHACPPAMHTPQPCMPPGHACPSAIHAPEAMHTPCHACPPATHTPGHACPPTMHASPAVHAPLPCTSPAMRTPCWHTPSHAHPCRHACPLPPPCGQNSWHTLLKILPCPNSFAGCNKNSDKLHLRETDLLVLRFVKQSLLLECENFAPFGHKTDGNLSSMNLSTATNLSRLTIIFFSILYYISWISRIRWIELE